MRPILRILARVTPSCSKPSANQTILPMVSVCRDQETRRMRASMQPQSSQSLVTLWFMSARPGPSGLRQLEVVFLRSQTGVKGLRCLLTYQSRPGHQDLPAFLSPCLFQGPPGWHTPPPALNTLPEAGLPFPSCSSLYSPVIWATWSFYPLTLWPLCLRASWLLDFPSPLPHLLCRLGIRSRSLWTLPGASGCFLLCIYYKLSPLSYLGAAVSSFLFLLFIQCSHGVCINSAGDSESESYSYV